MTCLLSQMICLRPQLLSLLANSYFKISKFLIDLSLVANAHAKNFLFANEMLKFANDRSTMTCIKV